MGLRFSWKEKLFRVFRPRAPIFRGIALNLFVVSTVLGFIIVKHKFGSWSPKYAHACLRIIMNKIQTSQNWCIT